MQRVMDVGFEIRHRLRRAHGNVPGAQSLQHDLIQPLGARVTCEGQPLTVG